MEAAVAKDPSDGAAQLRFLQLSLDDGRMDQAADAARRIAGLKPDAAAALEQALRAAPKRADLYWQAAAFLAGNDKPAEALLLLDQAERDLPGEREIPLAKAVALELSGQTAAAGDLLKEVQGRWPEWPAGWVARGIVLETHGGFEEARQALETAVSLGARSPGTYYYLADSTLRSTPKRIDAAEKAAGAGDRTRAGRPVDTGFGRPCRLRERRLPHGGGATARGDLSASGPVSGAQRAGASVQRAGP